MNKKNSNPNNKLPVLERSKSNSKRKSAKNSYSVSVKSTDVVASITFKLPERRSSADDEINKQKAALKGRRQSTDIVTAALTLSKHAEQRTEIAHELRTLVEQVKIHTQPIGLTPPITEDVKVLVLAPEYQLMSSLVSKLMIEIRADPSVATVEDGESALQALYTDRGSTDTFFFGFPFDLVFVPMTLPDMSGVSFLEKLRQKLAVPVVLPIIMLTAGGGTDTVAAAIKAGALDCIQSPIAIEVLKNRIRWFLETKWMRKKLLQFAEYETRRTEVEHMDIEFSVQERLEEMQGHLKKLEEEKKELSALVDELEEKNKQLISENIEVKKQNTAIAWKMAWDQKGMPEDIDPKIAAQVEKQVAQMKEKVVQAWESPVETLARTMNQIYDEPEPDKDHHPPEPAPKLLPVQEAEVRKPPPGHHLEPIQHQHHESDSSRGKELTVQPPNQIHSSTSSKSEGTSVEQLKAQLQALIEMIASANSMDELYTPALEKVFENVELDDMTKNYISYNFSKKKREKYENIERPISRRMSTTITASGNINLGAYLPFISEDRKKQLLECTSAVDFQVWSYTTEDLFRFLVVLFEDEFDILSTFEIPEDVFYRFLKAVREHYFANPYHNFLHAVDMLQTLVLFMKRINATSFLTKLETFAYLIAALCHDGTFTQLFLLMQPVNHPGLNNQYQVTARTRLALVYNDQSVLESHHCSKAFEILSAEETNIIAGLSDNDYREFRRIIIAAVMATDMGSHFEIVSRFKTRLADLKSSVVNQSDKMLIMNTFLHAADVSNVVKPWTVAKRWSDMVFEEFLNQGDAERENGLQISPYMDRFNTSQVKMSIGFIDYMCTPLFVLLKKYHPEGMGDFLDNMKANRAHWVEEPDVTKVMKPVQSPPQSKKVRPAFTQQPTVLAPVRPKTNAPKSLSSTSTNRLPTVTNIYNLDIGFNNKGPRSNSKSGRGGDL